MENNEMPIKAQVLVYKIINDEPVILCLKRSEKDGGFWHVLTGTMELNESLKDCIYREIKEEINISNIINISKELKRYVWIKNEVPFWVFEFSVQIAESEKLSLNIENDDFRWLSCIEAKKILEKDSAKELVDLFLQDYKKDFYAQNEF